MRKVIIFALMLVLTLSLTACREDATKASQPTDGTGDVTMPFTLPSNIPDPSVDGNSTTPEMTDGFDATGDAGTGTEDGGGVVPGEVIRSRVLRRF